MFDILLTFDKSRVKFKVKVVVGLRNKIYKSTNRDFSTTILRHLHQIRQSDRYLALASHVDDFPQRSRWRSDADGGFRLSEWVLVIFLFVVDWGGGLRWSFMADTIIGLEAQSIFASRYFCSKIMYDKLTKCPNFTWQLGLPEKYFLDLFPLPKFGKNTSRIWGRHPSPTPMDTVIFIGY